MILLNHQQEYHRSFQVRVHPFVLQGNLQGILPLPRPLFRPSTQQHRHQLLPLPLTQLLYLHQVPQLFQHIRLSHLCFLPNYHLMNLHLNQLLYLLSTRLKSHHYHQVSCLVHHQPSNHLFYQHLNQHHLQPLYQVLLQVLLHH